MRLPARRSRRFWFFAVAFLATGAPLFAGVIHVQTSSGTALAPVYAESQDDHMMVDLLRISAVLGSTVTLKDGEYVIAYASGTAVVNPQGYYRVQGKGGRKWQAAGLLGVPYFSGSRFLVALEDVPRLFHSPFTYHLQRKELKPAVVESADPSLNPNQRRIKVRHVRKGTKDWIAIEDVARELGVVVYASQAGQYTLVMPDFTFLDIKVGQPWVYRKSQIDKSLADPVQSLSGVPHATPSALSTLLEADIAWDSDAGALRVPRFYGRARLAQDKIDDGLLQYTGYRPRPLAFNVDEFSTYYQTPGPTYAVLPTDIYESVKDYATLGVVDPGTSGYDQWSGEARLEVGGSAWKQPLEGGVRLEKVGTRGRVADGALEWGFPRFRVRGGREFYQMGDFDQQLEIMDQIAFSHSNDHFAEGKVPVEWQVSGLYGQGQFFVFPSDDLFSQAVHFRQEMYTAGVESFWRLTETRRASFSLSQHVFSTYEKEVTTELNFSDIPGIEQDITVSTQAQALTDSVLTDRHSVTMASAGYSVEDAVDLAATAARSSYADPAGGSRVHDDSWRLQAILGTSRRKLTLIHQRTGDQYRSIGDPLSHKGRAITRVAPYWEFSRVWRAFGEFQREDGKMESPIFPFPFRNDTFSLGNSFSFRRFSVRHRVYHYDFLNSYSMWGTSLDGTLYKGRDSLEGGIGWLQQKSGVPLFGVPPKGTLSKQSYSGRAGYQILRPNWRLSLSQDAMRNHYPRYRLGQRAGAYDKWETTTRVLAQRKAWEGLVQYGRKPRYFRDPVYLYTGTFRVGWQPNDRKIINLYYAASSQRRGLANPQVWRLGFEFTNDFY